MTIDILWMVCKGTYHKNGWWLEVAGRPISGPSPYHCREAANMTLLNFIDSSWSHLSPVRVPGQFRAGDPRRHHGADRGTGERLGHGGRLRGVALPGDADVWRPAMAFGRWVETNSASFKIWVDTCWYCLIDFENGLRVFDNVGYCLISWLVNLSGWIKRRCWTDTCDGHIQYALDTQWLGCWGSIAEATGTDGRGRGARWYFNGTLHRWLGSQVA